MKINREIRLESYQHCKEFDRIYKNVLRILHERQESAGVNKDMHAIR